MIWYNEIYGCDADNNRGVASISYEIEESDKEEIAEKLYDLFISGETKGKHNIFMYCYIKDEDVELEVDIEDYIKDLIKLADADENIKDDEDIQEYLKEVKEALNGK